VKSRGGLLACAMVSIGLFLWLMTGNRALAQPPQYDGLDIVFIVDQSGSMCGEACDCDKHPEANDPLGLRFYGVQHAISWLGVDQWQIHPKATYQVAVVYFGTRAQTLNFGTTEMPYYWETISSGSEEEWLRQEAALKSRLAPGFLANHHLGDTNFLAAFEQAERLFAQLDATGAGQNHRRAIIVLTDGQAYVDEEGFSLRTHMEQLIARSQENFPSPRYTIYVVAMNDAERHYWNTIYANYWAQVTGDPARAQLVHLNETDVGIRFREILRELTQGMSGKVIVEKQIEVGPQIIPPYLAEVKFTFYKAEISESSVITDALGRDVKALGATAGVKVTGQDTPIEEVTVANPEPGRWVIAVAKGSETEIVMRQVPAQGSLEKPVGVQYREMPTQVVYRLEDINGNPLPVYQDPIYQLLVTATMQTGGQAWPVHLRQSGQSRYEGEFVPSVVGSYGVHVEAISHDLSGQRIEVLAGKPNPFEVRSLTAESRLSGNRLTQYEPAPLRFGLVDSSNLSAGVAAQISAQAIITDPAGQVWTLPLQVQQADEWAATFTPLTVGPHQIQVIGRVYDSQGREYVPLKVAVPPLEAVAPTVVCQLSAPPYRQYNGITATCRLHDSNGDPLTLDPAYQLQMEASLQAASHQQAVVPQMSAPAEWTAIFSPTTDGPQRLISTFKVKNMATGGQSVLAQTEQELLILKTTLVDLQITDTTNRRQPVRSVLFQPWPMVVEAQLLADGKPVAANQVMGGNLESPLSIRVWDGEGQDRSGEMVWKPTDRPGLFRAEGENLGRGKYTVEVQASAPLKESYMYGTRSQRVTIQRIENPVLAGGAVAGLVSLFAALVAAAVLIRHNIRLAQHPCRGFLVVVDADGRILWQEDLEKPGEKKRNRWVYDLTQAAPLSFIEKLVVTCNTDQDAEAGLVNVHVILDKGDELDFQMQPQSWQEIVPNVIWLLKDLGATDPTQIREMISSSPRGGKAADGGDLAA